MKKLTVNQMQSTQGGWFFLVVAIVFLGGLAAGYFATHAVVDAVTE